MKAFKMKQQATRRLLWLALVVVVAGACAWVFVPVWTIQPFKAQTPAGLNLSYGLRRWSPIATLVALALAALLVVLLWRGARRWWLRAALAVLLVPVVAAAWFARQNHFEWMFKPLAQSAYVAADKVDFVGDEEMVLAVEVNGDAVAYPIRQLAYHHVVEDTVGGRPVVSTY
jgi:glucan phosphoethanolaminetransferase (alkaline phosphatase superfamily)